MRILLIRVVTSPNLALRLPNRIENTSGADQKKRPAMISKPKTVQGHVNLLANGSYHALHKIVQCFLRGGAAAYLFTYFQRAI